MPNGKARGWDSACRRRGEGAPPRPTGSRRSWVLPEYLGRGSSPSGPFPLSWEDAGSQSQTGEVTCGGCWRTEPVTQPHERDGALPARTGRPVGARSSLPLRSAERRVSVHTGTGAQRSLPLPVGCRLVRVERGGGGRGGPGCGGHVPRAHGNTAPRPRGGSAVWGVLRE